MVTSYATKYKVVYVFKRCSLESFVWIICLNTIEVKFKFVAWLIGETELVPFIVGHIREAIESVSMRIIDLDIHMHSEVINSPLRKYSNGR